ncbi:MATE family efflux transporter [Phaeobacter sp. B1627]|uniref:MATE family efflux transporter n=1 Tax=Phaeobacter sp. B1627 TaxID=2583809 RepID=UPI0011188184|nr:MATE family efflux transporter [Phaeobacter sp. B1627]TNJ42749.1 MATE family efflux transporter [Phaeobacter sp. B1627]
MMTPIDLGSPALLKTLLRTALPAVGGLSINATHQGVDAFFVGQLGPEALAAVSLALPLTGVTAAIGVGLGVGTAAAVARALGRAETSQARRAAGQIASTAMVLCVFLAVCLVALLWGMRGPLLDLLGATQTVRAPASEYLSVMVFAAGFGMVQILCDFTAIGEGNARFSLASLVLCFGLNMALDPVLIFWFGWGVKGAALATVAAQLATLALYAIYFTRGRGRIRLTPRLSSSSLLRLWEVLRVGLPEAGSVLLASVAFVLLYRLAGNLQGAEGQAAMGIALRLWVLACLPVEGFCLGAQPVLAHAVGAGEGRRLSLAAFWVAAIAVACAFLFMVAGLAVPLRLAGLFAQDPAVLALAVPAIGALALSLPAMALRHAAQITLQATARARLAAILGLAPLGWLFLPVLMLSTSLRGFDGLAVGLATSALLTGIGAAVILWRLPRFSLKGIPA